MAKERKPSLDFTVYLTVRIGICVILALPYEVVHSFARLLAWLAYHVDKRHRLVALDNLRQAFPGKHTEAELDAIVRSVYRHFCTLMMELLFIPRKVHRWNWRYYARVDDPRLGDVLIAGRPLMLVTGHFGNWEMSNYCFGLLGYRFHAIARPIDNPYVDDFLRGLRERTGQRLLAKNGDFDKMQSILENHGILGTLADQDAGQRGQFVEFFGRPASTHKAVSLMALQYNVVLLVAGCRKHGEPMRYEAVIEDIIDPQEYDGRQDAAKAITQRFTAAIERLVRATPEQYFWLHRRWKHQPVARKSKQAA